MAPSGITRGFTTGNLMLSTKRFIALIAITTLSLSEVFAADLSKEEMFTRLSSLASSGNSDVQYNLGMFLNNGIGTAQDNKAAFQHFSAAAESGNTLASYKVGCYLAGQFPGVVPVNEAEALKFKLRAAEEGYDLAQYDVGVHFAKKRDIENALLWWERASRQGNMEATAYLANYLSGDASPDLLKGYGLMLVLKERMPSPNTQLTARMEKVETKLTAQQKTDAAAIRTSWLTGKSPLTVKAQAGIGVVPALLASLQR